MKLSPNTKVLLIGVGVIFDIAFDAGFTPILTFPRQGEGLNASPQQV